MNSVSTVLSGYALLSASEVLGCGCLIVILIAIAIVAVLLVKHFSPEQTKKREAHKMDEKFSRASLERRDRLSRAGACCANCRIPHTRHLDYCNEPNHRDPCYNYDGPNDPDVQQTAQKPQATQAAATGVKYSQANDSHTIQKSGSTEKNIDNAIHDVYVKTSGLLGDHFWKNGRQVEEFDIPQYGQDNGDIYSPETMVRNEAGIFVARIIKNSTEFLDLTSGYNNAGAFFVFVSNGDVFTAGYEEDSNGIWRATVWKNDRVLHHMGDGMSNAYSVFVIDGDVYAAGHDTNSQGVWQATVWKNGELLYSLSDGSEEADAWSVFVIDEVVYSTGYEKNVKGDVVALVWKNDKILYKLGDEYGGDRGKTIFAKDPS